MRKIDFDVRPRKDKLYHFIWGISLFFAGFIFMSFFINLPVLVFLIGILAFDTIMYLNSGGSGNDRNYLLLLEIFMFDGLIAMWLLGTPIIYTALGFAVYMGVMKEVSDYIYNHIHDCDVGDAIYTALGGILGMIILKGVTML